MASLWYRNESDNASYARENNLTSTVIPEIKYSISGNKSSTKLITSNKSSKIETDKLYSIKF